jgi:hypothetical protein
VIDLSQEATLRVIGYLFSGSHVPVSMAIVVVGYRGIETGGFPAFRWSRSVIST